MRVRAGVVTGIDHVKKEGTKEEIEEEEKKGGIKQRKCNRKKKGKNKNCQGTCDVLLSRTAYLQAASENLHVSRTTALTSVTQRVATKPAVKAITDILENICKC